MIHFTKAKGRRDNREPDLVEEEEVEEQQIDLDRVCSFVDFGSIAKKGEANRSSEDEDIS